MNPLSALTSATVSVPESAPEPAADFGALLEAVLPEVSTEEFPSPALAGGVDPAAFGLIPFPVIPAESEILSAPAPADGADVPAVAAAETEPTFLAAVTETAAPALPETPVTPTKGKPGGDEAEIPLASAPEDATHSPIGPGCKLPRPKSDAAAAAEPVPAAAVPAPENSGAWAAAAAASPAPRADEKAPSRAKARAPETAPAEARFSVHFEPLAAPMDIAAPAPVSAPEAAAAPAPVEWRPIVRRLDMSWRNGEGEVSFDLAPRELGEVKVRLEVQDGAVTVNFKVDNESARAGLQAHAPDLTEALRQLGWRVDQVRVSVGSAGADLSGAPQGRPDTASPFRRAVEARAPRRASPVETRLVDLVA